jgi:hypothetical protein
MRLWTTKVSAQMRKGVMLHLHNDLPRHEKAPDLSTGGFLK